MRHFFVSLIFAMVAFRMAGMASPIPVVEIQAKAEGNTIVVFFSGDGGWLEIDQVISESLASKGIHVVGVDSRKYFSVKRTPNEAAGDISALMDKYSSELKRDNVILLGYSFGADVLPFLITRLSTEASAHLGGAVMLGIAGETTFQVSRDEWTGKVKGELKTKAEIQRIQGIPLLFIGGCKDKSTITGILDSKKYDVIVTPGDHHFDKDYKNIASMIFNWYSKQKSADIIHANAVHVILERKKVTEQ